MSFTVTDGSVHSISHVSDEIPETALLDRKVYRIMGTEFMTAVTPYTLGMIYLRLSIYDDDGLSGTIIPAHTTTNAFLDPYMWFVR